MKREEESNSQVLRAMLPPEYRDDELDNRRAGVGRVASDDLPPAVATIVSAWSACKGRIAGSAGRIDDPALLREESSTVNKAFRTVGMAGAGARAVRALHELVPVPRDLVQRLRIVEALVPTVPAHQIVWEEVLEAAALLAGVPRGIQAAAPTSPAMKALMDRHGTPFGDLVAASSPLAVVAYAFTADPTWPWRRAETTIGLLSIAFGSEGAAVDPWSCTEDLWDGRFVTIDRLVDFEIDAAAVWEAAVDAPADERARLWRLYFEPLAWVNVVLGRLADLGADVAGRLHVVTAPRPELEGVRPDGDLFDTEELAEFVALGLAVLTDPLELWAWRNLVARACRPQACLPLGSEIIPFGAGRWRVHVPKECSKTGALEDVVVQPIAAAVGWAPAVCPVFDRTAIEPAEIARRACTTVRRAWSARQDAGEDLPPIPDRVAYVTRKLTAGWFSDRVRADAFTLLLSHASEGTNLPYGRATRSKLIHARSLVRGMRP